MESTLERSTAVMLEPEKALKPIFSTRLRSNVVTAASSKAYSPISFTAGML